jgi:hypothetical protein
MCRRVSLRKKYENIFWTSFKVTEQVSDPDLDPLVRGTDPWIWIRTKMSRMKSPTLLSSVNCVVGSFCCAAAAELKEYEN